MKTKLYCSLLLLSLANCSTTIKFMNAKAHEKMEDNESLSGDVLKISYYALSDFLGKSDQNNKAFKKAYFNNDEKDKNIFALALGDSWFSYPRLNDTIDYLQNIEWCNIRIIYPKSNKEKLETTIKFQEEFGSKKKECSILVIKLSNKWTALGYNDNGIIMEIELDSNQAIVSELNKEDIKRDNLKIIKLLPQEINHTTQKLFVYTTAVFGKEMNQILHEKDFKRVVEKYKKINAVLISAGGNDILDATVLDDLILNTNNTSNKIEDYINKEYLNSRLNILKHSIESIALTLQKKGIPIFIHGYLSPKIDENNSQCKKRFVDMCEWIRPELVKKDVNQTETQQLIIDYLINQYNLVLKNFANDYNKKQKKELIVYINLKEKLLQNNINPYMNQWTDEIHPNEKLFGKIADILAVEIATKSKGRK